MQKVSIFVDSIRYDGYHSEDTFEAALVALANFINTQAEKAYKQNSHYLCPCLSTFHSFPELVTYIKDVYEGHIVY